MDNAPAPAQPDVPLATVEPTLPVHVHFDTTPYQPDGGFSLVGLLLLLVGLSAAGVLLGIGTFYVSKLFYLILLFPALIGLALGGVGWFLVKAGKVRAPWLAGAAGLVAGILAMFTQHYMEYHEFMNDGDPQAVMIRKMFKANPQGVELLMAGAPKDERDQQIRALKVESFFDYIDFRAHEGVTIKRAAGAGNDKGMNLGYIGSFIYWGIETLIVAAIVFSMTRKPALEPFCPITNSWKVAHSGDNFHVPLEVGNLQAVQYLKDGDLGKLAQLKAQGATATTQDKVEPLRLYVMASPQHSAQCTLDLKLVRFVVNKNGQTEEKELATVTYPADALPSLEKFCT